MESLSEIAMELRAPVERAIGINLRDGRGHRLVRAMKDAVRSGEFSASEARGASGDPDANARFVEKLIPFLAVGETYFFRSPAHFQALRDSILPSLVYSRQRERTIRIWSAGCATGEEAYSVAITIDRDFPQLAGWDIELLGTDLNTEFLAAAQRGRFRPWSFRGTDIASDPRYFRKVGSLHELDPKITSRVAFRRHNLALDPYPRFGFGNDGFDVIFFRNVAIYLRVEVIREIVANLASCLRPGGFLILGEAELREDIYAGAALAPLRCGEVILLRKEPDSAAPPPPKAFDDRGSSGVSQSSEEGDKCLRARSIERGEISRSVASDSRRPISPLHERQLEPAFERPTAPSGAPFSGSLDGVVDAGSRNPAAPEENETAKSHLVRTISAEPLQAEPRIRLAGILEEEGDLEGALEQLRRAIYLEPGEALPYLLLGTIASGIGRHDEGARAFRNAAEAAQKLERGTTLKYGEGLTAGELIGFLEVCAPGEFGA